MTARFQLEEKLKIAGYEECGWEVWIKRTLNKFGAIIINDGYFKTIVKHTDHMASGKWENNQRLTFANVETLELV